MKEGAKNLPWEKEAYKKEKKSWSTRKLKQLKKLIY
jgi:23S rRNA U2552 (ribose-2'-O)-methylase RlmE/FtsJ